MATHRIASIPGDGIGAEVVAAGIDVLAAVQDRVPGLDLSFETFPWGSDYYRAHGRMMAEDGLSRLRAFEVSCAMRVLRREFSLTFVSMTNS